MSKEILITLSAGVPLLIIFALMAWGWRNKLKRQGSLASLPLAPAELGEPLISVPGQYVVTTTAGDWLDRVAVHSLGIRTPGVVHVHDGGVVIERKGAQDIFIAQHALTQVDTQAGMAGKFVERDGLVVISWNLDDTEVDTGFRTTEAGAKRPLIEALQALLPNDSELDSNGKNN
ncbi:PH-like domain-containing protein [Arthrobacter psychrolactophilus]